MPIPRNGSQQLDDISDVSKSTDLPTSLTGKETSDLSNGEVTSFNTGNEENPDSGTGPIPPVTGRTYPDMISENMNKPEMVIAAFIIISMLLFVPTGNVKELKDFLLPLALTIFLTLSWFTIRILSWVINLIKRRLFQK